MATHEFGMMPQTPGNERYDSYEPQKYHVIPIHDDEIESILWELHAIPCYWHTRRRPEWGLAYTGITLIPPASALRFIVVFRRHNDRGQYDALMTLFQRAAEENRYIIHFGI